MVVTGWVMVAPHHLGPGPLRVHAAGTRGVARGEVVQPDVGQLLRPPGRHGEQNAVDQGKVPLNILLEVKTLVCIHVVGQRVVGWNVPDLHSVLSAVEVQILTELISKDQSGIHLIQTEEPGIFPQTANNIWLLKAFEQPVLDTKLLLDELSNSESIPDVPAHLLLAARHQTLHQAQLVVIDVDRGHEQPQQILVTDGGGASVSRQHATWQ